MKSQTSSESNLCDTYLSLVYHSSPLYCIMGGNKIFHSKCFTLASLLFRRKYAPSGLV